MPKVGKSAKADKKVGETGGIPINSNYSIGCKCLFNYC